ncbi:MAG: SDR family NAD(P)-dependent oxidoreductase [Pseudonocardiaceae bacterium]
MIDTVQKVAVVTGASRGIGEGLVAGFRRRGYAVVATSRSITQSDDPDVLAVAGDIADPATVERVVDEGLQRFGRIDTLVNNAGVFIAKPFTEYTERDYASIVSVNLTGFFALTQRAVAQMVKQGTGHVVTITTSLTENANSAAPSVLAALTKGGLNSATKSLAIEYARRGIRANAVAPGIIRTPMHPVERHRTLGEMLPIGRMGEVDDVVAAVLYLESAAFVTGEILFVDGGRSAGH